MQHFIIFKHQISSESFNELSKQFDNYLLQHHNIKDNLIEYVNVNENFYEYFNEFLINVHHCKVIEMNTPENTNNEDIFIFNDESYYNIFTLKYL